VIRAYRVQFTLPGDLQDLQVNMFHNDPADHSRSLLVPPLSSSTATASCGTRQSLRIGASEPNQPKLWLLSGICHRPAEPTVDLASGIGGRPDVVILARSAGGER
jgi:hypothetical protein